MIRPSLLSLILLLPYLGMISSWGSPLGPRAEPDLVSPLAEAMVAAQFKRNDSRNQHTKTEGLAEQHRLHRRNRAPCLKTS